MADDTGAPEPVETPLPAAEPVAAPVDAPTETPAVEAPVETPAPEAPVEAPAEEAPAAEPVAEPAEAPAEESPAEAPAEAPAEEKPAEEAAEAPKPTYEAFKLPEGVKAEPEQMTAYHEVLGKYGLTQEAGQDLIDLHTKAIQETAQSITDQMVQRQTDVFTKMQDDWREEFYGRHPNNHNTVLDNAKFAVADTIKNAEKRKAFWGALSLTGAGNHPDVVDGLAAIGKRLREGSSPPNGLPANSRSGLTAAERRYGPRT